MRPPRWGRTRAGECIDCIALLSLKLSQSACALTAAGGGDGGGVGGGGRALLGSLSCIPPPPAGEAKCNSPSTSLRSRGATSQLSWRGVLGALLLRIPAVGRFGSRSCMPSGTRLAARVAACGLSVCCGSSASVRLIRPSTPPRTFGGAADITSPRIFERVGLKVGASIRDFCAIRPRQSEPREVPPPAPALRKPFGSRSCIPELTDGPRETPDGAY